MRFVDNEGHALRLFERICAGSGKTYVLSIQKRRLANKKLRTHRNISFATTLGAKDRVVRLGGSCAIW